MRKLIISFIILIFILVFTSSNVNAALNFTTYGDVGVEKVGDTFEIEFTNSIFTQNEKTKVTITYNTNIIEYISSSDPNLVLNKNNSGVVIEVPNNYTAKLVFKCISATESDDGKEYLKFVSNDSGLESILILGVEVGVKVNNSDNENDEVVEKNTVKEEKSVEKLPNTGSLDYIIPSVIAVILVSMFVVYRKNKSL